MGEREEGGRSGGEGGEGKVEGVGRGEGAEEVGEWEGCRGGETGRAETKGKGWKREEGRRRK